MILFLTIPVSGGDKYTEEINALKKTWKELIPYTEYNLFLWAYTKTRSKKTKIEGQKWCPNTTATTDPESKFGPVNANTEFVF